jgi:hypothetical protein
MCYRLFLYRILLKAGITLALPFRALLFAPFVIIVFYILCPYAEGKCSIPESQRHIPLMTSQQFDLRLEDAVCRKEKSVHFVLGTAKSLAVSYPLLFFPIFSFFSEL